MKVARVEKNIKKEWKNILFNVIFIILSLLIILLLAENEYLSSMLLIILAIVGFIKWKSRITFILFLFCGIFFGVGEIIIINYNLWAYTIKSVLKIPIWLFILWGNTGAFIFQTALEIKKLGLKK